MYTCTVEIIVADDSKHIYVIKRYVRLLVTTTPLIQKQGETTLLHDTLNIT